MDKFYKIYKIHFNFFYQITLETKIYVSIRQTIIFDMFLDKITLRMIKNKYQIKLKYIHGACTKYKRVIVTHIVQAVAGI